MAEQPSGEIGGGRKVAVEVTPIGRAMPLIGRVCGACAAESTPQEAADLVGGFVRWSDVQGSPMDWTSPSQEGLLALEAQMRQAALSRNDLFLLGLNASPAVEQSSGQLLPFLPGPGIASQAADRGAFLGSLLGGGVAGGGVYQLVKFPIARFNGIPLPANASIRFADPSRWLSSASETRLFTISIDGTNKFYSWDAHAPVGKTPHDFYHVNQKGMYSVFGESDHAALTGAALIKAKQLRYLKVGGRIFLVVGVIVDGIQLGAAGYESYEKKSIKPVAAQAIRTTGGWAAAWAGAKAGAAVGGLAGVESGPGMVLTAIGGGIIGGVAGYWGANWIADWVYDQ
jgi:hypothetical protein